MNATPSAPNEAASAALPSTDDALLPIAQPSPDSAAWWRGLTDGRLLLQRCNGCGTLRLWPRPMCATCHSMDHDWVPARGQARVHSWTVAHHAFHPAMAPALPFGIVTADLPEGVRLLARYDGDPATLRMDLPLRIAFETRADGVTLPVLRAA